MTDSPRTIRSAPRRRWARRIVWTVLIIALLAALAGLAVEIVLRTDYPRRLIAGALQEKTGLRIDIGAADVGWGGRTVVRDVVVRLPLEN
jgi:hypothetical protein